MTRGVPKTHPAHHVVLFPLMAKYTCKIAPYYDICTSNAVRIQFRFLSATTTQYYVTIVCCGKLGEYKSGQIHGNIVTCSLPFLRDQPTTTISSSTMNKAVILIGTACLVAIAIVQVSAQFTGGLGFGAGLGSVTGGASRSYYDNYYQQYERYNRAQAARTIATSVNGLQTSSLIGLCKYKCTKKTHSGTLRVSNNCNFWQL